MAKSEKKMSALERALSQALGDGRAVGLHDDPARERWPSLWEWLTTIYVGKDWLKQPATISIRLTPEGVVATVVDRDLQSAIEANCPHLGDILEALDRECGKDNPNLKTWGKGEPKLRKRKSGS